MSSEETGKTRDIEEGDVESNDVSQEERADASDAIYGHQAWAGGDIEAPEVHPLHHRVGQQQQQHQPTLLETVVEGVPGNQGTAAEWSPSNFRTTRRQISFETGSGLSDNVDDDRLHVDVLDPSNFGNNNAMNRRHRRSGSAQIRTSDFSKAMDQNVRRRHMFQKRVARFFGKGEEDEENQGDGMKISMHGRLMVQPAQVMREKMSGDEDDSNDGFPKEATQYKLSAIRNKRGQRAFALRGVNMMYEDTVSEMAGFCPCSCTRICSDKNATTFLHWSFRSSFMVVFGTAAVGFFALTFLFAFIVWIIGQYQPYCIGGVAFENSSPQFTDAYALSWTTFSTVGYGSIYPQISRGYEGIHKCTLITILTTFESFVGVLFASLCGAIIFAKVARVQSFAQVTFSDPMVIRYGSGLAGEHGYDDDDDDDDDDGDDDEGGSEGSNKGEKNGPTEHIPCPVLEFRIINRLNSISGGEIIDASLNMVASIDAYQSDPTLAARQGLRRKGKKGKIRGPRKATRPTPLRTQANEPTAEPDSGSESSEHELESEVPKQSVRTLPPPRKQHSPLVGFGNSPHSRGDAYSNFSTRFVGGLSQHRRRKSANALNMDQIMGRNNNHQSFEEDPSGKIMPKKILSKLETESMDHPFFRRIWLVRHTLDMNSPIVKTNVRHMLRRNNGFWPKELNSYESIRESVQFDQILVSLTGTSNADANSVYAQHVYYMVDVNIGYRFVNALYRDPINGGLRVDATLLNDVHEQAGGGGEPFHDTDCSMFQDMLVL